MKCAVMLCRMSLCLPVEVSIVVCGKQVVLLGMSLALNGLLSPPCAGSLDPT